MEKVGCEICEAGKILGYTKKPPLQREQVEGEFTNKDVSENSYRLMESPTVLMSIVGLFSSPPKSGDEK